MASVAPSRALSLPAGPSLVARPPRLLTIQRHPAQMNLRRASSHVVSSSANDKEKHFEFREDVGECDIKDAKDALEACKGLEGQALEDCWASFNCNVDKVTDHYAKVAGVPVPDHEEDAGSDKSKEKS